jgi:hypothetical protein
MVRSILLKEKHGFCKYCGNINEGEVYTYCKNTYSCKWLLGNLEKGADLWRPRHSLEQDKRSEHSGSKHADRIALEALDEKDGCDSNTGMVQLHCA